VRPIDTRVQDRDRHAGALGLVPGDRGIDLRQVPLAPEIGVVAGGIQFHVYPGAGSQPVL